MIVPISELRRHRPASPVVAVNGCFDLFHDGHLHLLTFAATFGNVVVGINSDASVRKLKGLSRPIIPQDQRARIVAALRAVQCVCIYDGTTAVEFLQAIAPDVWVKGIEYRLHPHQLNADERAVVESCGGRIEYAEAAPGISTTRILAKAAPGIIV